MRNLANEAPWNSLLMEQDQGRSSFGASYDVTFLGRRLLSIRFLFFAYHFGAMHPIHWTRTVNLFLDPVLSIELKNFFNGKTDYLAQISSAARKDLLTRSWLKEGGVDKEMVLKGTEADATNFQHFNFSNSSLVLTFDEYAVGPYSAGRQEVSIPFSSLSGLVLPDELNAAAR